MMVIFDFDQTLVDTSSVERLRGARDWKGVMAQVALLPTYPGIDGLLASIHGRGDTLAIVTKSPDMVAKWFIRERKWPVDIVVGYHHVKRRKPDPEGLLLAMEKAGASPSGTFHVGDQPHDTEAAQAAGVVAIGATWGLSDPSDLIASGPDYLFNTVDELRAFLAR